MKKVYIKNLILSGLFFALICIGFFFLYREINKNHLLFETLSNDYRAEEDRRKEIQSLNKAITEIEKEITELDSHFIKESEKDEQVALFLGSLEDLATKVSAKAEVTSVEVPNDKIKNFFISLRLEGSFNSIYKFLLLLENSRYELDVVSVKILRESGGENLKEGELPKWRADFKLKINSFLAN
jgi:hypothetical protein